MLPQSELVKVVPRTFTDAMEQLQEGYVTSVAATAGVTVQHTDRDMHKYDLELVRQPSVDQEEVSVRLQLKSTTTISVQPGATHFNYRFDSRASFDSLAMQRSTVKHILVVMLVHPDQNRWSFVHHRAMLTRQACYWAYLEGRAALERPLRPVVSVPLGNIFDARALTGILDRIEVGGTP
ncbi:DUF4365 domain-containing protein [Isoptericola sp. F-RaC21]|uniref:DUF4365 domain-containing protein n=1 Tax=Isoptericola sp. F-RaC21 TaxID=3141452 RepID=UPI00315C38C2